MSLLPEMPQGKYFAVVDIGLRDSEPEFFQLERSAETEANSRNVVYSSFDIWVEAQVLTRAHYAEFRRLENERIKERG